MQVILLERVDKLGQMGQVVNVRDGFARNFLIPKGRAMRATKDSLARFEQRRAQLEARNLERRQEAETLSGQVAGRSVVILRQAGESGVLYGSVAARDIVEAFSAEGLELDRQQIRLDAPLKALGVHGVPVALHPEVVVEVTVNIARSKEEAEIQSGGGAEDLLEQPAGDDADETGLDEALAELEADVR